MDVVRFFPRLRVSVIRLNSSRVKEGTTGCERGREIYIYIYIYIYISRWSVCDNLYSAYCSGEPQKRISCLSRNLIFFFRPCRQKRREFTAIFEEAGEIAQASANTRLVGEEASSRSLSHAMDRDSRSYSCGGCERTAAEGRAMPME